MIGDAKKCSNTQRNRMNFNTLRIVIIILLVIPARISIGQNVSINPKKCYVSASNICNPFVSGFQCLDDVLRTTHGSPSFYATDSSIQLNAAISTNGTMYSEGFTLAYQFTAGKKYGIKIKHKGLPQTGAVIYPNLIVNLTNNPARYNDGCNLGYLTSINVISQTAITMSSTVTTSTTEFTPSQDIFYIWFRSSPVQVEQAGLLISSIEIVDYSIPGSTPPGTYYCPGSIDFCGTNYCGFAEFHTGNPLSLSCDAFRNCDYAESGYIFVRRFMAPEIVLSPGFFASGYNNEGSIRHFRAFATSTPCSTPFRVGVNDTVKAVKRDISMDEFVPDKIHIYPSPSKGLIKITSDKSDLKNAVITVTDQSGRVVHFYRNLNNQYIVDLNLQHLTNGIYYIRINKTNKVIVEKLLISK